jgi:phosphoribosyl-ATP pyrophosphohydrolase
MSNFRETEAKVYQWGKDRGIVQHGKPMGQAIKTLEETTELLDAINKGSETEVEDAIGDIMVTLVMVCATMNLDMQVCFEKAYQVIKNRRGYLDAEGVFHKEKE